MKTIVNVVENLLKPYVDNKDTAAKQAVESNIAPVEADATSASESYSEGEQLVLNDILYDVTASITAGDPLTVGVNISAAPKLSTAVRGKQEQIDELNDGLANEAATRSALGAKNRMPLTLDSLKQIATSGTWNNNVYSENGIDYTVNTNSSGYVTSIIVSGTASNISSMNLLGGNSTYVSNDYAGMILTGCPSGGGNDNYRTVVFIGDSQDGTGHTSQYEDGNGVTIGSNSYVRIYIRIASGTDLTTPITFYPMIRVSTDSNSDFEPYADDNQTLTAKVAQNASDISSIKSDLANLEDDVEDIKKRIDICYGFEIDGSESNPSSAVTYIADAVGFTPAAMNYGTNAFDYGSWEDAFFMPRPCMLKSDGTVDYYLDPDDYTKKEDGTASDIANTAYDGNAMMEWGRNGRKIWIKIQPSSDRHSAKVWIANNQVDSKFHDYSFHNCKGESAEHFYTPIYNGSVISSKMRSLSGQTVSKALTGTAEITAAKANNPSTDELWNIECFADRVLINMLLILMGKSLDTQTVFGQGANSGGSEAVNDTFTTGVHDTKGLFYGTNSGAVSANTFGNCVKVFGMENYYGFQWRRTNGLILNNGATKYKLTYGTEDGSAATGYNTDGTNYKDASVTPSGTSGGYISAAKFTEDGMFNDTMSGSASTYFCDGTWFNNSAVTFALFGGDSGNGAKVGAFCLGLAGAVSTATWYFGASVSCKPLA